MPSSPKLALADDENYILRGVPTLVPGHGTELLVAFVSPTPPRGQVFANEVHVALLERTPDGIAGRYRLRDDATHIVHSYTYDAELDDDDRAGSRLEMAFSPTDPTALFAWTWDAPTLYKLHVDPRRGVRLVCRRGLGFRPVRKANFGLGMYFTRDGRYLHLVSTCPWDDYQFDALSLSLLQRTRSCPWPYASISYVGYSNQVLVAADAVGALVALELNSRSFLGLQLPTGDHLHVSLGATQLSLVPCYIHGRFALSATALHEKRRYHGVFRDIWHLLEISPLQLQPWVPPTVQWPRTADGDFDDDDVALAPVEATPTITYALALDLPDAPWVEVTASSPSTHYLRCSPLCIDGEMYQLDIVRPHTALIRHPISNACMHVLQYNEVDDIEILHVLSRGKVLSWTSPFLLASGPLQLATPMVYKPIGNGILPTDDAVFQAAAFHYTDDDRLATSTFRVLGPHTLAMVLSAGYLCLADLLTMLRLLPSLRRDCFQHAEMRRCMLRTHFLDCVESTFLWPDDAAHYEAKAASLLLFLTTIHDEEAYELLAASAYFKLRGERRDRTLARDYLEMLPPKTRTLHGKNGDVVVIHVSTE
ncbi:hypothetical protein SPRG_01342 [Saprolegnia parasitica CBS 223.65]|uniref:Uncharacterized protein n=1 Tax=Saprolegnia parasitica (strain CBS 223.65) TaxID=695850 RepID=A0A067CU76_SAPPC|nr:hypothetical protein SPRG_01342 [Saprolegnia parasitica CBS 223.65]KDO34068.1 hypothetical protein SPRG_01342 [Saprolegnia parasitica CBS 223.65]|eukprot:XP_012194952.1 hypothetical protein SPRG_01342 [Saprolegnia parasitica CBS 223.65]